MSFPRGLVERGRAARDEPPAVRLAGAGGSDAGLIREKPIRVLDASAAVEVLRRTVVGRRVRRALIGALLVVPAHFDAEVLSALSRMARAGDLKNG